MSKITKMYRCNQVHDDGETTLIFVEFNVARQTELSAWINDPRTGKLRRVSKDDSSKQPYAHTSKEAALRAFFYRKKRQLTILKWQCRLVAQLKKTARIMLNEADSYQVTPFDVTINHNSLDTFKELVNEN